MSIREIKPDVFSVGAQDWTRKYFDNLVPIPNGTSYNSYFIKGSEKTALIDTVYPPKAQELINQLKEMGVKKLDYVISNHAEQDHSGSLAIILQMFPEAIVITNEKCKEFLLDLHNLPEEKITVISDNDTLSLGNKTLRFLIAPWVHWPDTMFTYIQEDKILFTCDLFGSHIATSDLFVKNECEVLESAKRYYAEIMMPFRVNIRKHLERIKDMSIDMYAPSHGPIYNHPQVIFDAYKDWASDVPKNEVVIPYISMYDSTTKMVNYLADKLMDKGITVHLFELMEADTGKLAMSLVDAATIVIGTSMVLAGPHPKALYTAYFASLIRPKAKFVSVIGSYGWAVSIVGKLAETLKDVMPNLKMAKFFEPVFAKGLPKEVDYKNLDRLANEIYENHKALFAAQAAK